MIPSNSYHESIAWLFKQFPSYQVIGSKAYKPTLQNIKTLFQVIDNPQNDLRFVHVAGSNGKGSVCAFITSIAVESNYKTGLFTSPHIKDFRERIRINGNCISESDVVQFIEKIRHTELHFSPSFFEVTFAMALDHFRKHECELCVIETGLGGRLDATNIITPLLSVITTISLEHQNLLGNTLEEIASEKGGIIKKNRPVVLGEIPVDPRNTLYDIAERENSPLYQSNSEMIPEKLLSFPLLQARYQQANLRTAIRAIRVLNLKGFNISLLQLSEAIQNLSHNTGFFGRLDVINTNPLTIYDVSHNLDGIRETFAAIQGKYSGRLHIVYGTSSDKDISKLSDLFPSEAHLYLTEFSNSRSAKLDQLREEFRETNFASVTYWRDAKTAFKQAQQNAAENDCILVTGSFFLVAEFY